MRDNVGAIAKGLASRKNQSPCGGAGTRTILDKIEQFGFDAMFVQIPRVFCAVLICFCFKLKDRT
jgi:hypothetical protein